MSFVLAALGRLAFWNTVIHIVFVSPITYINVCPCGDPHGGLNVGPAVMLDANVSTGLEEEV